MCAFVCDRKATYDDIKELNAIYERYAIRHVERAPFDGNAYDMLLCAVHNEKDRYNTTPAWWYQMQRTIRRHFDLPAMNREWKIAWGNWGFSE